MWSLPKHISQSTLDGRQGSNACTLIALIVGRNVAYTPALYTPRNEPLPDTILKMIMQSIREGNRIHDINFHGQARNLSVEEGSQLLPYIGIKELSPEFPVDTAPVTDVPRQATLEHYLQSINQKQVCVFIRGAASVVFFKNNTTITMVDSHQHGHDGALILQCRHTALSQLMQELNRIQANNRLGSAVVVTYA